MNNRAVDLFAGARGWDIAARHQGWEVDGVEIWDEANATATANGFQTVHKDVTTFHARPGRYTLGIASPSCKRYSMAGNGAGRRALDHVLEGVQLYGTGQVAEFGEVLERVGDADAALTLEPLRIFLACEPVYIAMEQVPSVLPVWEAYAGVLRDRGYSVVTATLGAEQYGVPQTRRRSVLLARRDGEEMTLPRPTHSRFRSTDPGRLDDRVKPWVSMAEALDWGMTKRPSMTVTGGGTESGGAEPFGNAARAGMRRELAEGRWRQRSNYAGSSSLGTTAEERGRTIRDLNQPSVTVTVTGKSFQWESSAGRLRVTPEEAAILQTFPADYVFTGKTKGARYQQIGNAVPPVLAGALLSQFPRP